MASPSTWNVERRLSETIKDAGRAYGEHVSGSDAMEPTHPTAPLSAKNSGALDAAKCAAVFVAAIASGPFAVVAAFVENSFGGGTGILLFVLFGPAAEEAAKGAGAFALAEQRPWLVPHAFTLPLITFVSGLVFAAIENWWYLEVLINDPSAELVLWRWIAGPILHAGAALVTGMGLRRMWRRSNRTGRPQPADAEPS